MEEGRPTLESNAVQNGENSNGSPPESGSVPRDDAACESEREKPQEENNDQDKTENSVEQRTTANEGDGVNEVQTIKNGEGKPKESPVNHQDCPSSDSRTHHKVGENTPHSTESTSTESETKETAVPVTEIKAISPRKAKRRGIFVSYSPDASFTEKRFISYTIKELKNIGFCDDLWFDKDESSLLSPFCFQERLEIAEKCRGALMFLSDSYFNSRLCRYEGRILLGRDEESGSESEIERSVRLFCIKYNNVKLPSEYRHLEERILDLSKEPIASSSIAEKSSAVVGNYSEELEKYAGPYFGFRVPSPPQEPESSGQFMKKNMSSWNFYDVQEWLVSLKLHERFILNFEEQQIDGYMLLSMSESDLESHLNVDSRVARRKLLQQMKQVQEKECQAKEHWYLRHRRVKSKADHVYIIYDPGDAKLAGLLKSDLNKSKLKVFGHERLGQSKQEFLQLNSAPLFACSHVVFLMTAGAATSLFVYNEVLFADWLGKPIVVALMENSWDKLRPCLQVILGNAAAVNFEGKPSAGSMDVLVYHLKPLKNLPVILEQDYLDRMEEGVKPLKVLLATESREAAKDTTSSRPMLFISYHLDDQTEVQGLVRHLENNGFDCWTDMGPVGGGQSASRNAHPQGTLQGTVKRNMTAAKAVVCCVTYKYVRFKHFAKDLALADSMHKLIVPVMLQWLSWPPEGDMRRILAPLPCVDMSNKKLFKRNLDTVLAQLKRNLGPSSPRD